ncbi:MAG: hypothetical protein AAGG48_26285 [Planctomycetota bacterium]
MTYYQSVTFEGDPGKVLSAASQILMPQGFTVTQQQEHRLEFDGPGMNSSRQDPIRGASEITVEAAHGRVTVCAEYGGVESMRRFVTRFPLLLGLGIGAINGVILFVVMVICHFSGVPLQRHWPIVWLTPLFVVGIPLLAVSPWFFLGPALARKLQEKTTQALDSLLSNVRHSATID